MWKSLWQARSYRYKILALLIVAVIPLWGIVGFYVLPLVKEYMYDDRKVAVRNTVDLASKVLEHYYDLYQSKVISEDEAKAQALGAIAKLR